MNYDKQTEAMKLALGALEESLGYVEEEAENAQRLYGQYPTRQARIQGLKDDASKHMNAITAIREALAEQETVSPGGGHVPAVPVAVYGYCPECGGAGVMRERRPNGDDKCTNGHKYPSSKALAHAPTEREQPAHHAVDWEKMYLLEVKKKNALAAKYERDTGTQLTRIIPMAEQPAPVAEPHKQQEPVAWVDLIREADEIVRGKVLWKRFIDGTPLANDIAVWMADFAQKHTSPPASKQEPVAGEPLPCPFCGNSGLYFDEGSTYRWGIASCSGCGASCGEIRREYPDKGEWHKEAIAEWNRRTSPPANANAGKPWVGLTDEDLQCFDADAVNTARYWEAKLRERNEHREKNA